MQPQERSVQLPARLGAASGKPSGGPRTAVGVFRPSPGKPPEAAPAPTLGPRDRRTGKVIDIASLIG